MTTGITSVRNVPERSRYEIELDGEVVGFAQYRRKDDVISFLHTEVDEEHEGEGLGGALISAALEDARRQGAHVLPFCPFVRSYIQGHPEMVELVPQDRRAAFGLQSDG